MRVSEGSQASEPSCRHLCQRTKTQPRKPALAVAANVGGQAKKRQIRHYMTKKKLIIIGLIITTILIIMGIFGHFKKSHVPQSNLIEPYKDKATNLIYNLLFCDNLDLYKSNSQQPNSYPFDI